MSRKNYVAKLDNVGAIQLTGPQASEYLQGQITIDTASLTHDKARLGAHCDFKGKTWSVFTALNLHSAATPSADALEANEKQSFLLISSAASKDKSLAELKKYGVFSKVEIEDSSSTYAFYGVKGQESIKALSTLFPSLTTEHLSSSSSEKGVCVNYSLSEEVGPIVLVGVNTAYEDEFRATVRVSTDKGAQAAYDADMILHGLVLLAEETTNEFVPQMLNLQAVSGIDFDKGCYMGQETVARTKFLGKNKRATYILEGSFASEEVSAINDIQEHLQPGSALEKQAGDNWRSGGTLLQISAVSEGPETSNDANALRSGTKIVALAGLSNDTEGGAMLRLKAYPGLSFIVGPLPYTLDEK